MRVLARVDGRWTVADIARDLELTAAEVMALLDRLERIGAVRWLGMVELAADDLEDDVDCDRPTSPDPSFERPTWPTPPPTLPP